jgi:hypothetical protein
MDPQVGLDNFLAQNHLDVINSLYRVEAPCGWEGGYREARGGGGPGGTRGELPYWMRSDRKSWRPSSNRLSATNTTPVLLIGKPGR